MSLFGAGLAIGGQSNPMLRTSGAHKPCVEDPLYPIGMGVAVVDTVAQWVGLSMLILGLVWQKADVVADEASAGILGNAHWFVSLGSRGSPLGLTAGLTGW